MLNSLASYHLESMKFRQRIALAVRLRIETQMQHKEAARKTTAFLSLPLHMPLAMRLLYRTVDTIWYAVGDTSTDFSFYTRRMSLAAIYASTFLYWLNDKSLETSESWEFLERRLDNVMAFGKAKSQLSNWLRNAS